MTWQQTETLRNRYDEWARWHITRALYAQIEPALEGGEPDDAIYAIALERIYNVVGLAFFEAQNSEFERKGFILDAWNLFMKSSYIRLLIADKTKKASQYLRKWIDENPASRTLWRQDARSRRETIASTEVVAASSLGSLQAARMFNSYVRKRWLATQDGRTRYAHAAAHLQATGVHDHFIVGGERLEYPGDPNGSAHNIANCRCSIDFF